MKFFCKYLKIERNTNLTEYIKIHQPENMWPEIVKGMEDVGILGMELYHVENMIIMTMRTTDSFCADRDLSLLASKPRQSEWEAYVSSFQGVDADASAKAKWTEIPEIYSMEKCQKYLEKQVVLPALYFKFQLIEPYLCIRMISIHNLEQLFQFHGCSFC